MASTINPTVTHVGLVTEATIPAFGPYSRAILHESDAPKSAHGASVIAITADPEPVFAAAAGDLISTQIGSNFGAVSGSVIARHGGVLHEFSGVIVGVNDFVVQFADEDRALHVVPLGRLVGVYLN
jgi:hypothetical protein